MSANRTGKSVKKERTLRKTTSNLDVLFVQFRGNQRGGRNQRSTQYEDNYRFFRIFGS